MGSLLFGFKGRIGSSTFLKVALLLIAVTLLFNVLSLVMPSLANIFGIVTLLFIWPWLALWVKRYHDDGKSGWMCLLPIIVMIILFIGTYIYMFSTLDFSIMDPDATQKLEALSDEPMKFSIPVLGISLVIQLVIVFLFNAMIKSDPEENQFGTPTN